MRLLSLLFFPVVHSIIRGLNTFGFETEHKSLMCDWVQSYDWMFEKIHQLGFNTIRLPFCYQYIYDNDFSKMDEVFDKVDKYDLDVVLDFHRIHNYEQSPTPWHDNVKLDDFIFAWEVILERYKNNNRLVGVDIFNEYQSDNYTEWNDLSYKIVSAIENRFPNRFWFIVGCVQWNGNCHFVNFHNITFGDRVFLGIHKYCWSDTEPFEEKWTHSFGTEKIIVGEFGALSNRPDQMDWLKRFIKYLKKHHYYDSFFWSWSWNSGDTGGILKEDCSSIEEEKMNLLRYYWDDTQKRNLRSSKCPYGDGPDCIYTPWKSDNTCSSFKHKTKCEKNECCWFNLVKSCSYCNFYNNDTLT